MRHICRIETTRDETAYVTYRTNLYVSDDAFKPAYTMTLSGPPFSWFDCLIGVFVGASAMAVLFHL